jgi:hypothetical protein
VLLAAVAAGAAGDRRSVEFDPSTREHVVVAAVILPTEPTRRSHRLSVKSHLTRIETVTQLISLALNARQALEQRQQRRGEHDHFQARCIEGVQAAAEQAQLGEGEVRRGIGPSAGAPPPDQTPQPAELSDSEPALGHLQPRSDPALRFNDLAVQFDKDEQQGFMMMFWGAVAGLRNP